MNKVVMPVTVECRVDRSTIDPLSVYLAAVESVGKEDVFILESLSGPSRDCKTSVVGLDSLFSVLVYEGYATVDVSGALRDYLAAALHTAGFHLGDDNRVTLEHDDRVWELLRVLRDAFQVQERLNPGMAFFGFFSYDTVRFVEKIPSIARKDNDQPIIALTVFRTLIYFKANGEREIIINQCELWENKSLDDYGYLFQESQSTENAVQYPGCDIGIQDTVEKEEFLEWVEKALHHIRMGDIYQIQLGHEIHIKSPITPFDVYLALRNKNPSPYMYLAKIGGIDLIGASPELFVRVTGDLIEMRPIAGTVGKRPGVDSCELIQSMTRSEKERAEHIMLVDLCRNDIGRVCQPYSLEVDELMIVEEYSHLYHMVSNVKGLLQRNYDAFDVIKASFPAGTMTGAPKVRAMEIIEGIEKNRRGIYAGSVGIIGFDGSVNTALCIRSAVHDNGTYYLRASAGIVDDSDPEKEWEETLYKMSSVFRAITDRELIQ